MSDLKEQEISRLSPAEKFDLLVGDTNYSLTKKERSRTNVFSQLNGTKIPRWFGLCHAWAPATILFDNPGPVVMKNADGVSIAFGATDVKALLTYFLHEKSSPTYFASRRCNIDDQELRRKLDKGEISHKEYKETMESAECRGINAGAFHIILSNMISIRNQGFIADVDRGAEVWNQAIHGYSSKETKQRKNNISRQAAPGTVKEVRIETVMTYTIEIGPSWEKKELANSDKDIRYVYWLELDKNNNIIGGAWESNERPDFLWNRSRPKFTGKYKILSELYKKSIADEHQSEESHSEEPSEISREDAEIHDNKISNLNWSVRKNLMHFRTKISGSVGDNISKLELIIKDDGGRVQVKKKIKIKSDRSFRRSARIWSWKAGTMAIIAYNKYGQKVVEQYKSFY